MNIPSTIILDLDDDISEFISIYNDSGEYTPYDYSFILSILRHIFIALYHEYGYCHQLNKILTMIGTNVVCYSDEQYNPQKMNKAIIRLSDSIKNKLSTLGGYCHEIFPYRPRSLNRDFILVLELDNRLADSIYHSITHQE